MTDDWIDIKDKPVPKDGSWFVIWVPGFNIPEVGRHSPDMYNTYEKTGLDGLYKLVQKDGFDNMHAATHWMPLKPPGEKRYMTANEFKSCLNVVKQDGSIVPYLDQEPDTGETGA